MWLQAPNVSCVHGFSTRMGGVSAIPFDSLNLGGSDDSPDNISKNRSIALESLGFRMEDLCNLRQVHGAKVNVAKRGMQEGDALVSNEEGLVLAVSIADCYPILFHDPKSKVIGAAHAGWRGTLGKIAAATIEGMKELGATEKNIRVAIGQGISKCNFEVGDEVKELFLEEGFEKSFFEGRFLDLIACNRFVLHQSGILPENIWSMNRCTFESDFFSHRQSFGKTGRMWAVIAMK